MIELANMMLKYIFNIFNPKCISFPIHNMGHMAKICIYQNNRSILKMYSLVFKHSSIQFSYN